MRPRALCALLTQSVSGRHPLDFSVITSAYGKNALQQYLNENSILYIDPDKKRTNSWLSLNRLQLPLGETSYDSIRKISYADGKVKVKNIKRGKLLKDVTKIRNITKDIVSSYGQDPKSNFLRDASMDSIRNSDKIVNNKTQEKFSDRDQNVQEANRILQKQNDELKDLVSYLREIVRL